jgi:hypothetical protein
VKPSASHIIPSPYLWPPPKTRSLALSRFLLSKQSTYPKPPPTPVLPWSREPCRRPTNSNLPQRALFPPGIRAPRNPACASKKQKCETNQPNPNKRKPFTPAKMGSIPQPIDAETPRWTAIPQAANRRPRICQTNLIPFPDTAGWTRWKAGPQPERPPHMQRRVGNTLHTRPARPGNRFPILAFDKL